MKKTFCDICNCPIDKNDDRQILATKKCGENAIIYVTFMPNNGADICKSCLVRIGKIIAEEMMEPQNDNNR